MHMYQAEIKYLEDWEAQRCPILQAEFLLPGFLEAHIIKFIYIHHRSSCQHMESCLRVYVCMSSSSLQTWGYYTIGNFCSAFSPSPPPPPYTGTHYLPIPHWAHSTHQHFPTPHPSPINTHNIMQMTN